MCQDIALTSLQPIHGDGLRWVEVTLEAGERKRKNPDPKSLMSPLPCFKLKPRIDPYMATPVTPSRVFFRSLCFPDART